jgi:hypothetical protein
MHVLATLIDDGPPFEFFDVRSIQINQRVCLMTTPRGVECIMATLDIKRIDSE